MRLQAQRTEDDDRGEGEAAFREWTGAKTALPVRQRNCGAENGSGPKGGSIARWRRGLKHRATAGASGSSVPLTQTSSAAPQKRTPVVTRQTTGVSMP